MKDLDDVSDFFLEKLHSIQDKARKANSEKSDIKDECNQVHSAFLSSLQEAESKIKNALRQNRQHLNAIIPFNEVTEQNNQNQIPSIKTCTSELKTRPKTSLNHSKPSFNLVQSLLQKL